MAKKKTADKIPDKVKKILDGKIEEPSLSGVAAEFFAMAGGARAVAKLLWDTYRHPQCSAMVQHRIMETILRATKFANQQAGPPTELGLLSQVELEQEAAELLRHVVQHGQEETTNKPVGDTRSELSTGEDEQGADPVTTAADTPAQ
jgi:hypothetical protein